MGVLRQISQLFWKNFVMRKREPYILVLEILWPILVFIIVAVTRSAVTPEDKPTCSYAPHAMPSAGLVPFLQSSICNIDNKCEDRQTIENRLNKASRLSKLVSDVEPFLREERTLDALNSIETAVDLAEALVDPSNNLSVSSLFGNDTMTVKSFFKDPGKVRQTLVHNMKVMSAELADAFLNSNVNVITLLNSLTTGYVDFKGIVCSSTDLGGHMIFTKDVNITAVSLELCNIPDDKIPDITDLILQQIDLSAIFRVAKSITALTNDYVLADGLDDIASLIDLLSGTSSIGSVLGADLQSMKSLLNNIPKYMETFNKMSQIDIQSIDDVLTWVEPLVLRYSTNSAMWNETLSLFSQIKQITSAVGSGTSSNWTSIIKSGTSLLNQFNLNDTILFELMKISSVPDLTNLTMGMLTGDWSALEQLSSASSLNTMQMIMEAMFDQQTTQVMLRLLDFMVDMAGAAMDYMKDLSNTMGSNSAVTTAVNKLMTYGPNVTMEFLARLMKIDNVMALYNNTDSYVTICQMSVQEMTTVDDVGQSELISNLCVEDITRAIQQINTQAFQKQMETYFMNMDRIISYNTVPSDLRLGSVFTRFMNLTGRFQSMESFTMQFINIASSTNIDMNNQDWTDAQDKFSELMISQAGIPVLIVTVGPVLEETKMWKSVEPMFRSAMVYMEATMKQMEQMRSDTSSMAKMNEMLISVMEYSPEITQGIFNMMKDQRMLTDVFSSTDMDDFCGKKLLLNMSLPAYVPIGDINNMLCTTDWTAVMEDMVSVFDMTAVVEQAMDAMSKNYTNEPPYDWVGMVKNMEMMTSLYSDPSVMTKGNPIVTLLSMNMSNVMETFTVVASNLEQMTSQNITDLTQSLVFAMKQLDGALSDVNEWRMVKHYMDMWDSYVNLANKQLENSEFDLLEFDQLMSMSPTFARFINSSTVMVPGLLDSLKNTTMDVSRFFDILLKGDWDMICQGSQITDLLSADSDLSRFENQLCTLNWTAVVMELAENQDQDLLTYMEKVSNLAMVDLNNVSNIDLDFEAIFRRSEHMFELLMNANTDKLMEGFSWEKLLMNFDLERSSLSWNNFTNIFTMTKDLDVENLMRIFDGLNSIGSLLIDSDLNQTMSMMETNILQSQLYQQLQIFQFIIKQLKYFNDTKDVDLRIYFNSPEMNKIFNVISMSPEVSSVALLTIIETLQDPNKVNGVLTSFDTLCTDLSVFKSVMFIPENVTVNHSDLQSKICGLNLNFTKLFDDLMSNIQGLPELIQALTEFNGTATPTQFWKTYETYSQLLVYMSAHPPNITISSDNSWLTESMYSQAWQDFLDRVNNGFKPENIEGSLTTLSQKTTEAAIATILSIPEFSAILDQASIWMEVVMYRLNSSSTMTNLTSMFDGYPEMEKVLHLMDHLPDLYQVWVFNSIFQSDKITSLLSNTNSWDQFCSDTSSLSDLPGSNFSISHFQTSLCDLNLTQLLDESIRFNAVSEIENMISNRTGENRTIQASELMTQFNEFSQFMTSYISNSISSGTPMFELPEFLMEQHWTDAMEGLNKVIGDPELLARLASNLPANLQSINNATDLQGLLQMMVDGDATFRQYMQTTVAVYNIMEMFIGRIENKTIIRIEDMFRNATETIKLWNLFTRPGVLDIVLNSLNTPQMTELFSNDNVTAVFITLCNSGNFSQYFTVPTSVSLDLNQLEADFCAIDLMAVISELMEQGEDINTIMNKAFSNSTDLSKEAMMIISNMEQSVINPLMSLFTSPPDIELPPHWMNATYWLNVLTQFTESRQDQQEIATELFSFTDSFLKTMLPLDPILNFEFFRSVEHLLNTYLELLTENLEKMNSTTISLDNLFSSIPSVSGVYSALQIKDSALMELLQSPMKNPMEFAKLMTMSDPFKYFCEDEKHWHVIFVISADVPDQICSGNMSAILENLFSELKISDFTSAVQNMSIKPDWNSVILKSMKLAEVVEDLISSNNINFDAKQTLNVLSQFNSTDILLNFLSYFQLFSSQINTTDSAILDEIFLSLRSTQVSTQLANMVIRQAIGSGNGLDLSSFITNTSSVTALLNSLGLEAESVNQLFSGFLKPDKVSEFFAIVQDEAALMSFLCNADQWQEIFQLNVNVSDIIGPLCQNDSTDVLSMLARQIDLSQIIPLIMDQNTTFDVRTMAAEIEQLTSNLLRLFNVSSLDYTGVDFDNIGMVNMTELMSAIEKEAEKLNGLYPDLYSELIENLLTSTFNLTQIQTPVTVLAAANIWISVFNKQLQNLISQPLNLTDLLYGSNVGKALDLVLKDPSWMNELFDAQLNAEKLLSHLMNSSDICNEGFWDDVVTNGNLTSVHQIWRTVCDLNETVIVQEAMSGFVNSYMFQQQLVALTEELNKGIVNISSLYPNIAELSSILENLLQGGSDVTNVFNATSFANVLERFTDSFMKNIGQEITKWSSMFLPLVPMKDETMIRAFQTFNVIMEEINNRLGHLEGTVSLSSLLQNSTELVDIFDSILKIVQNGTTAVQSSQIDVSKLTEILGSANLFTELCNNKTLADYISPKGTVSGIATDLGKVMCLYQEAFAQVLMDESRTAVLQEQIDRIWNSSIPATLDWTAVQRNINNFTSILTTLMDQPLSVDPGLVQMLDFNLILNSLESLFTSPKMISAITGSITSMIDARIPVSVYPYYLTWQEVYDQMHGIIRSLEGSSVIDSQGAIQSLWNTMLSLDSSLGLIQQNATYSDLVANIGKDLTIQAKVCDLEELVKVTGSDELVKVHDALCGKNPDDWNQRLIDAGYPQYYGYFLLTSMQSNGYINQTMNELAERFTEQIQNLTTTLSNLSPTELNKLLEILVGDWMEPSISQEFYQSFNFLNLIDNTTETWLLGLLNFVTEINTYVEKQFTVLKGMGTEVPLSLLLPNSTAVSQLLESALGSQTAATVLAFNMAPEKFLEIALTNSWEEMICQDVQTFMDTFGISLDSTINVTRLQKDLCDDLSKQDSAIKDILSRLDMEMVFKAFDDWIMGKTIAANNKTDLYKSIQTKIEEFVTMVTKVNNMTLTQDGLDLWLSPIWAAMEKLSMPQDSVSLFCDSVLLYMENTDLYRESVQPVLVGVYLNMKNTLEQIKLQTAIEDLICSKPTNSSDFLKKIITSNITTMIQKVLNPSMNTTGSFQCSEMVELSNHLSNMINESIYNLFTKSYEPSCVENFLLSFVLFIEDASSSFQLMQEILNMITDPSLQSFFADDDLVPLIEFILKGYSQQQAVSLKFSDLLTSPGDFNTKIQQAVNLAPEIINSVLQSTVTSNPAWLSNMTSAADLRKILCNTTALDELLTLPTFSNLTTSDLSSALCNNATDVIANVALGLLDIDLLTVLGTSSATDVTWWTVTLGHLGDVIGQVNSLTSLPALDFTKLDFTNLQTDLLIYMQKFLFDNGPEVIARSLNLLIEDFARLDPSVLSEPIVKDIQTITLGLTSFKAVRNFIPPNVLIRDVIKDRAEFRNYLTNQLNLSSEVADAVIGSTIQYASLLQYNDKDIPGLICNATRLESILTLPATNATMAQIAGSLCGLSEAQAINLTQSILLELDIGEMVQMYVTSGLDSFFVSLNKTQKEVSDSVTKLTLAQEDFQKTIEAFQTSTENLGLNIFLEPEYLTGDTGRQTLGDILCGYETSRIESSDASSDLTGASSQLSGVTEMVARQESELQQLPGTCKYVYDLIKGMGNGPVLWEYLKPLLWGKVLYTPNTPASRLIAEKVYNSSFKILADVQRYTATWARGTQDLMVFISDPNMKSQLESVIGNPVVEGMMSTLFGTSGADFLDGFYSLNSINSSQIDAMSSIAKLVDQYLSCVVTSEDRFEGVETEQALEVRSGELNVKKQFLAGLVFNNLEGNGGRKKRATSGSLPKHVSYTIRMDVDNVMYTRIIKEQYWHPKPEDNFFTELRYFRGFIQLQDILDRSIISLQTGNDVKNSVYIQEFPTPCYKKDMYLFYLSTYLVTILMTIAWLVSVAIATRNLMNDREKGQEEILKIMGMSSVLTWWVWFICTMAIMLVVSLLCILTLRVGGLFVYTNVGILILYFIAFCFSTIMLCYMVSSFFTKTTLALMTVVIVYFLSYLPYIVLVALKADMLFWQQTLACLSSTTAFGFAAQHLARYETLMEGIQWSNIDKSPITGDQTSFSWSCIMMVIDGVIYLVIGWYVRNIKPGKFGVAQPWYFFLSPYYWCNCCDGADNSSMKYRQHNMEGLNEPIDTSKVAGITIQNLTKKFGKLTAVDNISAEFYEHQVTVLLGHNGAAKTTTLNMITGVLSPSTGSVRIYGKSPSKAQNIGICPQFNALFDYMTVAEHMKFYGSVKSNWSKHELEDNVYQLLKEVSLLNMRDVRVSQLSGGMQKRLSVALAFVGGSEVVILDEPSSGVDPSARRAMWNLIIKMKTNCTVLLSTHFLDEADMIGDRIAIMHNGRIMCSGSPHFLKAHLGSGYHLKIAKGDNCDQMSVMGLITSLLPKADLVEDIGAEMTVFLSATVANVENLQQCLHQLDLRGTELGIASYGIYDTTLEEVFLKVCNVCDKGQELTPDVTYNLRKQTRVRNEERKDYIEPPTDYDEDTKEIPYTDPKKRVGVVSQSFQQIGALLIKRFHHYRRDWRMFISVLLLPLLFVTTGLGFMSLKPTISAPKILLTPAMYGPDAYMFYQDNVKSTMTRDMGLHLYSSPGPGTSCMAGMDLGNPYKCVDADVSFHTPPSQTGTPQCSCQDSKYTCNDAAKYQEVPWITSNTTDKLLDLNGHDITDYLLRTRSEFIEKRYGGLSFNTEDATFRSTIWFNNKGHHALPAFYNTLSNTMLRTMVQADSEKYGISAYSHPLMLTSGQLSEDTLLQKAADYGMGMIFLVAFTFIPAGLVVFLVNEYIKKEKQLQFLSGVGPFMYWTTSLLWDMGVYCIIVGLSVAIMAAFQHEAYWDRDNLQATVTLIILFGWAMIPLMYMTIKLFKDATTSYMVMFCLSIFIGLVTMAIIFILQFFSGDHTLQEAYLVLKHVFKIFPPYNLVSGVVEIIFNQMMADILNRFGDDPYIWPFDFKVIGWHLVALAIEGFVFFIITLLIEIRVGSSHSSLPHEEDLAYTDEAVVNERSRVMSKFANDDVLVVNNLTKEYTRGRREFYAVDHVCVGIPKGECFGLLGENGAGKTTSFRMLTGDLLPTAGEATLKGQRITRGDVSIGQEIGYSPQEDALDNRLTGREMLHCYARLRGLPTKSRKYVVDNLIRSFGLKEADKVVHTYSGGMKRKLSVAIAMIGEPPVVLLDEPTTGMDPSTRRHVWDIILKAIKNDQSVVLSSHSMEECDALCTRLAIMVNGEFKCLGSPQMLKDRYGDGYIATVYLSGLSTNKVRIRDSFLSVFHGAKIREDHQGVLQIEVPKGQACVAAIFDHLERIKSEYNIVHYSVSQNTLDNVFLYLTKDQHDGLNIEQNLDSHSDGDHSDDTWGDGASDAFANPSYAYNNTGFMPDKERKFKPFLPMSTKL